MCPSEEGRGFFQDLPFFPQNPVLPPQAAQLVLFVAGQSVMPLAGVQIRLLEPQPQRFAGHAQILGNLPMGFPAGPGQPDRLRPEFWRIGLDVLGCFRHGQPPGVCTPSLHVSTKVSQLQTVVVVTGSHCEPTGLIEQ